MHARGAGTTHVYKTALCKPAANDEHMQISLRVKITTAFKIRHVQYSLSE